MDAEAPPSYQEAIAVIDPFSLLESYLSRPDLCAAVRVCQHWNRTLAPFLWRSLSISPLRAARLSRIRPSSRGLVRILHIRPEGAADDYHGPSAGWLRQLIDLLPCLESVSCHNCPRLDHASLIAAASLEESPSLANVSSVSMTSCGNITATALAALLPALRNAFYLDLSYTPAAKHAMVLQQIGDISPRILKLRGIGLRSESLVCFLRERSPPLVLDLSTNELGDLSIPVLIRHPNASTAHNSARPPLDPQQRALLQVIDPAVFGLISSTINFRNSSSRMIEGTRYLVVRKNRFSYSGMLKLIAWPDFLSLDLGDQVKSIESGAERSHATLGSEPTLRHLRCPLDLLLHSRDDITPSSTHVDLNFGVDLQAFREARLQVACQSQHLCPAKLRCLKTLRLTNVPTHAATADLVEQIIRFVDDCAVEARVAVDLADLDYTLPPGSRRSSRKMRQASRAWFSLEEITLELLPDSAENVFWTVDSDYTRRTRSVTEDADSEALWQAAESDFSFFQEQSDTLLQTADMGRENTSPRLPVDVVGELTEYRQRTKESQDRLAMSSESVLQEARHWDGAIVIMKPG